MIKAVFFDLDGTLLPMDQDVFTKAYFGLLAKKIVPVRGYDMQQFIKSIWYGLGAMQANDGTKTNEEAWWQAYCSVFGPQAREDEGMFYDFYVNEFQQVAAACGRNEKADAVVKAVKARGLKAVLATNPVFPQVATASRMKWAGLDEKDFELFTTYEDYSWCKPNFEYYRRILDKTGLKAEECAMIGNDVGEDMVAEKMGMKVFLLTDDLINKSEADINRWPHGGFDRMIDFINNL